MHPLCSCVHVLMRPCAHAESGHGKMSYLRTVSRSEEDRQEQRKVGF